MTQMASTGNDGAASLEVRAQEEAQRQSVALPEELISLVERLIEGKLADIRREVAQRVEQAKGEGRAEAERLAGMSGDERLRYETERNHAREEELERREAELRRRELRARAIEMFVDRGLPRELGEIVDCTDEQSCMAGVGSLERIFREAVQRSVDERLNRGHSLPRSGSDSQPHLTRRMRAAAGLGED